MHNYGPVKYTELPDPWAGLYSCYVVSSCCLQSSFCWHLLNKVVTFSPAQCLNAVRTVQSLACLDEADHTVGFLLQLSSFCKEWQFHLPKLLRDVQASQKEITTSMRRAQLQLLFSFW